jgi:hypothetical protein
MFAMDRQWWDFHLPEVNRTFLGARFSTNPLPQKFQLRETFNISKRKRARIIRRGDRVVYLCY